MYSHENINLINKALKLITILLVTLIEFLISILIFYFIFVTFGAGIKTSIHRTLFFSLLSCLFCVMPSIIFLKHDNPFRLIKRILAENDCKTFAENVCAYIALGFVVGSWFGALFIPLDWDSWWQEWPISCSIGGISFSIMSALLAFLKY